MATIYEYMNRRKIFKASGSDLFNNQMSVTTRLGQREHNYIVHAMAYYEMNIYERIAVKAKPNIPTTRNPRHRLVCHTTLLVQSFRIIVGPLSRCEVFETDHIVPIYATCTCCMDGTFNSAALTSVVAAGVRQI